MTARRFFSCIALASGLLISSTTHATTIFVSASVNISAPLSADSSESVLTADRDASPSSSANATADNFDPFATVVIGTASAHASSSLLGVMGELSMASFDPAVVGNEANVFASALYRDEFATVSDADSFYLSPIFDVNGLIQGSAGLTTSFRVGQTFFSTTSGFHEDLIYGADAPSDGTAATIEHPGDPSALRGHRHRLHRDWRTADGRDRRSI